MGVQCQVIWQALLCYVRMLMLPGSCSLVHDRYPTCDADRALCNVSLFSNKKHRLLYAANKHPDWVQP